MGTCIKVHDYIMAGGRLTRHATDAALQPQDRRFFESSSWPERFPDLEGGAADGHTVGRCFSNV